MTLIQSLDDPLTWDTIRGFAPIFIMLIAAYGILVLMFLFLSRPRNNTYAKFKPKIKPRNRIKHWIRSLRHSSSKTRFYSLYGHDRHIPKPVDEARISAVGSDLIDIHVNRGLTFDFLEHQFYIAGHYADPRFSDPIGRSPAFNEQRRDRR